MARARLVLPLALVGSLVASGGTAAARTNIGPWAGYWWGHDRGLTISRSGRGLEGVDDGCCTRDITMTFQILRATGTRKSGQARIRVVSVRRWHVPGRSRPHPGQVATLRLRRGVLTDGLTGATFCAPRVDRCGV